MKLITKKEKLLLKLMNYEISPSSDDNEIVKVRNFIKNELNKRCISNIDELISNLKNEIHLAQTQQEIKRMEEIENRKRVREKVFELIDINGVISYPTRIESKRIIKSVDFKKLTKYAREYYRLNKQRIAFDKIHSNCYKMGAHYNYYELEYAQNFKIQVVSENDWNIYSKKTKYPAHHYTFKLSIPKNYSLTVVNDKLVFVKGVDFQKLGAKVKWVEQSRGLELRIVDGFLVKNELVVETKSVTNIWQAQIKVAKKRGDKALMRFAKISTII